MARAGAEEEEDAPRDVLLRDAPGEHALAGPLRRGDDEEEDRRAAGCRRISEAGAKDGLEQVRPRDPQEDLQGQRARGDDLVTRGRAEALQPAWGTRQPQGGSTVCAVSSEHTAGL